MKSPFQNTQNLAYPTDSIALGLVDRHYQRFELGTNLPSFQNIIALADHFQVNADYLLGRTDVREMLPPSEEPR